MSEGAEERPLVCLVDDVQWLDQASAQALAFAARRLLAEPVLMVFAAREPGADFAGLPELVVEGLQDADARELLASVVPWPLDEQVRERILAETRGNPLALLELPRGRTPAELAGGFALADVLPLSGRIEERFGRQLAGLPAQTRRLLQLAAADPVGDAALVWRAAERLGIPAQTATPAVEAGLVEFTTRVRFRHPLVRAAAYRSASIHDRRDMHRALAEATDAQIDPDRRAWHRACAVAGPDEDVAADLQLSAGRARARGGLAAAAAFLERATTLTSNPAQRVERALAAAQTKVQAGAFDAAAELLAMAAAGPLDDFQRARVDLLHAQLALDTQRGADAAPLLLAAAKRLERIDIDFARATYLDAMNAAMFGGRLASPETTALEVAQAARAAPAAKHPASAIDLVLDGLATHFTEGYAAGLPILRRALNTVGDREPAYGERHLRTQLRWLWPACVAAAHVWDDEKWDALCDRHLQLARDAGALTELPLALTHSAYLKLFAGDLAAAVPLIEELQALTQATGISLASYGAVLLAALRGREDEASPLISAARREAAPRGEGIAITVTHWATALLYNGLGRYHEALDAAEHGAQYPGELALPNWSLVELIEAAVRTGAPERATDALRASSTHHQRQWHRLGAGNRGAFTGAAEPGRDRRGALPRGDRASRRAPGCVQTWPALICSTANGYAARIDGSTHASSSGPPTRCSPQWASKGSPSGPAGSCWPPAKRSANGPSTRSPS